MKWVLQVALFFLSLSLVSAQDEDCQSPFCQAYVWGFPLWHTTNQRYLSTLSPAFNLNTFVARVKSIPLPNTIPQLTTCNASLCSGTPSIPLNPSPVNAPYTYFVYGAFTWDLGTIGAGNPGGAIKFVLLPNNLIRYASFIMYDQYTNIVHEFNSLDQNPNTPTIFCLSQIPNHPACAALPAGHINYVLPRFGFAIIRAHSSGAPATPWC